MSKERFLDTIGGIFKDPIQDYEIIADGYGNIVYEINKEWIFRFSKDERNSKQLEIEASFLPIFEKQSPLPIPHIQYTGCNYIGYKKLSGVPLTNDICKTLSSNVSNSIWRSIGVFLSHLHSIEFTHENLVEFPLEDSEFWNDLWEPIKPHLSKTTRDNAYRYFTEYFEEESKNPPKKTICHGDFHPNHILFNQSEQLVSGIIDFGRICLHDPAIDFNLIERFYGKNALEECLKNYNPNVAKNFRKRITFQNRRRLFAAFYHAKIANAPVAFERYIQRIEDTFK